MSIQSSFLTKKFVIDSNVVRALEAFNIKREIDVEEGEVKDGKSPTNTKGFKPQTITTIHKVSRSAGIDPRKEFDEWTALIGKRGGFHVEGRRISAPAVILDRVEIAVTAVSNGGDFLAAEIHLTFSEDVNFKIAPKSATEKYVGDKTTPEEAPGYRPTGATKSAYDVRPSASAAEAKM